MASNIIIDNAQGGIDSGGADISLPASPTVGAALVAGPNSAYAELTAPPLMRNRVINGAQMVSQRYDDRLITPAPGVYTTDRWIAASNITRPYSVYFDGSGDYLSINSATTFGLNTQANWTIEFWINIRNLPLNTNTDTAAGAVFSKASEFLFYYNVSGYSAFAYRNSANTDWNYYPAPTTQLSLNSWNHIAICRNGTTLKIFINGSEVHSSNWITSTYTNANPLTIGGSLIGGYSYYVDAYISNLRIVSGSSLYTANFTPSTTQLTAVSGTSLLACASSTIVDKSSNAFAITPSGNAAVNNLQPFGNSWSNYFDGTDDRLTPPASSQFAFGTGDFTIEFWFNSNDVSSATQKGFFQTSDTAGGLKTTYTSGIFICQGANKSGAAMNGGIGANILGTAIGSTGAVMTTATWYHCALTRASGVVRLFLNGALIDSATISGSINATNLVVGGYYSAAYSMNGYISNFRIIKGTALYTSDFAPPTGNLDAVAGTSLLTCASNSFKDKSSNNFTITPTGNAAVNALSPFSNVNPGGTSLAGRFAGWSNYFDGNGDYLSVPANTAFDFGTGDFTLDAWIYISGNSAQAGGANSRHAMIVSANNSTIQGWSFGISGDASTTGIGLYIENWSSSVNSGVGVSFSISQLNWHHIAISRQNGTVRFFFNGIQQGANQTFTSNMTAGSSNCWIGALNLSGFFRYLNGYISNLRIVKGTALYTTNFTPSTLPLVAVPNTSLLTCASEVFQDKSTNNFTVTKNGDVAVSSLSPFTAQAPAGFTRSLGWSVTSPWSAAQNEYAALQQRIEGTQIADLAWGTASAKLATLSFWVRSPVTGTYCMAIRNSALDMSYVAEYSIAASNTWEKKTIQIPAPVSGTWITSSSLSIYLTFDLGSGAGSTGAVSSSWQSGNYANTSNQTNFIGTALASGVRENNFMITGVQLEAGSVATPFEVRPAQVETALCQRYYAKMRSLSGNYVGFGVGISDNSTRTYVTTNYPTRMRTSPVVNANSAAVYGTSAVAATYVSITSGLDGGTMEFTSSAVLTSGRGAVLLGNNDPNASVELNAEL